MNYNTAIIISILITAFLSLSLSYVFSTYFFKDTSLEEISQLILAILLMTTFYASIKHFLLKYMEIKEEDE